MKLKTTYILLILSLLLSSCSNNPEEYVEHINGYWEILNVEKDNTLVKEYKISTIVDYFEVNNNLSGIRKKVSPTLEGTYKINQDYTAFTLKIENDSLNIYYKKNEVITKETILRANKKELIISNSQGFIYTYKPFEKIEF